MNMAYWFAWKRRKQTILSLDQFHDRLYRRADNTESRNSKLNSHNRESLGYLTSQRIRQFADYDTVNRRNSGAPFETFALISRSLSLFAYGRFAKLCNYGTSESCKSSVIVP